MAKFNHNLHVDSPSRVQIRFVMWQLSAPTYWIFETDTGSNLSARFILKKTSTAAPLQSTTNIVSSLVLPVTATSPKAPSTKFTPAWKRTHSSTLPCVRAYSHPNSTPKAVTSGT